MKQESKGKKKHSQPVSDTQPEVADNEQKEQNENVELKACEEKNAELQDKYLRLSAEFDNFRKRTHREKMDLIKTASGDLLIKILPVIDDIERGLVAVNTAQDLDAVKQGMNLIYSRFKEFLQTNGIKEIEALSEEFNTDFHEAVTKIPVSDEAMKGKVVDVVEKGYYLYDKVIRYPKVVVGE
jgi:molecular chaperone GrpE